jgi:hypothetical protein
MVFQGIDQAMREQYPAGTMIQDLGEAIEFTMD